MRKIIKRKTTVKRAVIDDLLSVAAASVAHRAMDGKINSIADMFMAGIAGVLDSRGRLQCPNPECGNVRLDVPVSRESFCGLCDASMAEAREYTSRDLYDVDDEQVKP